MIFAAIATALQWLGVGKTLANKLAPWALLVAGVLTLCGGFALWLHFHDRGVVEADRAISNAKTVGTARAADDKAEQATTDKRAAVEEGNRDAQEAARKSDDPLADGLRKLRKKPAR